ncbi:uncharacterized protein BX664DRAFT_358162 [Halteromyces radiatus]|uniref:uncharacterized protein n=1 Tax=Halteromyces radiatus TaxID=101107 RepID=UPI00221F1FFC|nr:uncharacterized protein BX664DRAFT_358162 [Halteromyces radiatus]KAI8093765.1 hypothetical protein BX664DRAFT_358162 [Halteromyces radiatus]
MLILRHNTLTADELFHIERKLLKAKQQQEEEPTTLAFNLYDKSRADIYGILLSCFQKMDVIDRLGWTSSTLLDFLIDVDQGYLPNAYHSFHHAVDVTLVLYYMLREYDIAGHLSPVDIALLFVAGLCHDIGHPGLNNNYQVNMKTDLACRYNNRSVLESYSCSITMELMDKHQLLSSLETYSYQLGDGITEEEARLHLIKMILATDMMFHYELQENMAAILDLFQSDDDIRVLKSGQKIKTSATATATTKTKTGTTSHESEDDTVTIHIEQEGLDDDDDGSATVVIPKLRDIFATLGDNSPLLFFQRSFNDKKNNQSKSSNHSMNNKASNTSTDTTPPSSSPTPSLDNMKVIHSIDNNPTAEIQNEDHSNVPTTSTMDSEGGICLGREHRLILSQAILHAADISNPLRPWPICYHWSQRVCTEFFHQGDMERENHLPLSPNMDRRKTNQLAVGLQFSDFVVSPYFEIFAALFPKADDLVVLLKKNRLRWLETIQDENRKRMEWKRHPTAIENISKENDMVNYDHDDKSTKTFDQKGDENDYDEDEFDDYDHLSSPLVPEGVINPAGRRVSVAAGMAVIPNDLEKRVIGSGPRRRVYWGVRSASYADALHHLKTQEQRVYHHRGPSQRSASLAGGYLYGYHDTMRRRSSEQPSLH